MKNGKFATLGNQVCFCTDQNSIATVYFAKSPMQAKILCDALEHTVRMHDINTKDYRPTSAACPRCGGWTQSGGMSQHANGPEGCKCNSITTAAFDHTLFNERMPKESFEGGEPDTSYDRSRS